MRRPILLAALIIALGACAPRVTTRVIGNTYPARPTDSKVALFSVRVPECPFEEIALIRAQLQLRIGETPTEEILEPLRQRARELGGDAIVGVTELQPTDDAGSPEGIQGTVIRFTQPEACATGGA
jgi:hypothetical protein